jgi:hypothetical protein
LQPPDKFSFVSIPVRSEHVSPTSVCVHVMETYMYGMQLRRDKLSRMRTEIDNLILNGNIENSNSNNPSGPDAGDKERITEALKRQFLVS